MAGCRKALGTCGSDLLVVSLFHGTGIHTYLQPNAVILRARESFLLFLYCNHLQVQFSDLYLKQRCEGSFEKDTKERKRLRVEEERKSYILK
jgi:hypothetical protein